LIWNDFLLATDFCPTICPAGAGFLRSPECAAPIRPSCPSTRDGSFCCTGQTSFGMGPSVCGRQRTSGARSKTSIDKLLVPRKG
jgi:hypothetical protein